MQTVKNVKGHVKSRKGRLSTRNICGEAGNIIDKIDSIHAH